MSLIYCDICKKNFHKKNFFKHKDNLKINILNKYFPNDISNIIESYKYEIEIYEKYTHFDKFIIFFDDIKKYETISVNYNCYKTDHYLEDIIYIMKNHFKNFNYIIRHMINGKRLKNMKINRKIFKLNIEYNKYNDKFYIRYK